MATPIRTCVGCRRALPKTELARIVRRPDGSIVRDDAGSTPGRGAYVCSRRGCFDRAVKGNRLGRALRASISPQELEALRREFSG